MQRYRAGEDLDRYEDDFIEYDDDDDRARFEDRYEDEEDGEEEEEKEEPMSEEAIKYLELRERLKAKHRSLLRRENGKNGVNVNSSKLSNFGSFFGPSKPVIADRVIQESKSLLETRHLAPKVSPNRNDANNKVSMPSTSVSNNGPRDNPPPRQVKSKAQIIKQTRDYSFLLSDDADIPKQAKDSGPSHSLVAKPGLENGKSTQFQAKRYEPSSHSGKNGYEKKKPSSGISQAHDARSAPPPKSSSANRASLPCDSRRQLELRKQPQPNKQVDRSSESGSRLAVQKMLPPKKPFSSSDRRMPVSSSDRKMSVSSSSSDRKLSVSSSDRKMPVSSSDRKMPVRSIERKPSTTPAGNRTSVAAKTSTLDRQSRPVVKPHASNVNSRLDHRRDVQRSTENRMLKRETIATSKYQPKQSSQNGHLIKKQNPAGQLRNSSTAFNKEQKIRKRKSPESESNFDFRAEIRRLFRRPLEYNDNIDDDDDDLEVGGFDTIMEEEKISERIAREEDAIELIKIQEEERQERLRKKAKMRRMNQR